MSRAKNKLGIYNVIMKPEGYRCYDNPFVPRFGVFSYPENYLGSAAKINLQVLSGTAANFDGKTINVPFVQQNVVDTLTLTFDDDAAPPSTASFINIQGLATAEDIADQIQLAFELNGFHVSRTDVDEMWIYQPVAGDSGNGVISIGDFSGELRINDVTNFISFDPRFYGGMSLSVPVLWGPRRGMAPNFVNNTQSQIAPG